MAPLFISALRQPITTGDFGRIINIYREYCEDKHAIGEFPCSYPRILEVYRDKCQQRVSANHLSRRF